MWVILKRILNKKIIIRLNFGGVFKELDYKTLFLYDSTVFLEGLLKSK